MKVDVNTLTECPKGAKPEETEHGLTCLHFAAKEGHVSVLRHLTNSQGMMHLPTLLQQPLEYLILPLFSDFR